MEKRVELLLRNGKFISLTENEFSILNQKGLIGVELGINCVKSDKDEIDISKEMVSFLEGKFINDGNSYIYKDYRFNKAIDNNIVCVEVLNDELISVGTIHSIRFPKEENTIDVYAFELTVLIWLTMNVK